MSTGATEKSLHSYPYLVITPPVVNINFLLKLSPLYSIQKGLFIHTISPTVPFPGAGYIVLVTGAYYPDFILSKILQCHARGHHYYSFIDLLYLMSCCVQKWFTDWSWWFELNNRGNSGCWQQWQVFILGMINFVVHRYTNKQSSMYGTGKCQKTDCILSFFFRHQMD